MKLDAALAIDATHLRDVARIVRAAEAIGFGALWAPETQHNGFFPLLIAAEHSRTIELGTAVTIAFPRSPMVMAQNAWDLQALSAGASSLGWAPRSRRISNGATARHGMRRCHDCAIISARCAQSGRLGRPAKS